MSGLKKKKNEKDKNLKLRSGKKFSHTVLSANFFLCRPIFEATMSQGKCLGHFHHLLFKIHLTSSTIYPSVPNLRCQPRDLRPQSLGGQFSEGPESFIRGELRCERFKISSTSRYSWTTKKLFDPCAVTQWPRRVYKANHRAPLFVFF
jgi:hypothetical protein